MDWKIHRCKHNSEENPPSACAGNKKACPSCRLQLARKWYIAVRDLPVRASKEAKSEQQREEEDEECDICAQWQDKEKKGKEAHNKQEEGEARVEANCLETGARVRSTCGIRAPGIKGWLKGTSETKPEGT